MSELHLQKLIDDGKMKDALNYISTNFSKDDHISDLYASAIYLTQGDFTLALKYALNSHDAALKISDWYHLCSNVSIAYAYLKLGDLEKSERYVGYAHNALSPDTDEAKPETIYWYRTMHQVLGSTFGLLGEYAKSISAFEYCLELSLKLKRDSVLPGIYNNLGYVNMLAGKLDQAHDYFAMGLEVCERVNNDYLKYYPLSNLGNYYFIKGEINRAERYHTEALELAVKINHPANILSQYRDLSQVYRSSGNTKKSLVFLQKSLEIGKIIGNPGTLATILSMLTDLCLEISELELAKRYFQDLNEISKQVDSTEVIKQLTRYTEALMLKSQNRIQPKSVAMEIFKEIIDNGFLDYLNLINAMLHLCELLLLEIKMTNENLVLEELNSLIQKLIELARKNNLIVLLIEVLGLQANLAIISGDFKNAIQLCDRAYELSQNYNLPKLVKKMFKLREKFIAETEYWESALSQNSALTNLMEMAKIDSYLQDIIKIKDKLSKK